MFVRDVDVYGQVLARQRIAISQRRARVDGPAPQGPLTLEASRLASKANRLEPFDGLCSAVLLERALIHSFSIHDALAQRVDG